MCIYAQYGNLQIWLPTLDLYIDIRALFIKHHSETVLSVISKCVVDGLEAGTEDPSLP